MRIADNRPTIYWVDVGRKQTPSNNNNKIPPNIDWFVSSLLANYKQYNLDASSKSQLIYFVYLLLNVDFQHFLVKLRTLLDIPQDGFNDISDFHKWQIMFDKSADDFSMQKTIDKRFIKILKYLDSKIGRRINPTKLQTKQEDPTDELLYVLVKEFEIDRTFYSQWLLFLKSVLFEPNPKQLLDNLAHHIQEEKLFIDNNKVSITLTRKSTINSIRETLNKNKDIVNQAIQDIKDRAKETELEVENLDRDYKAYKIYSNYSARNNKYSRDRKVDKVNKKIKLKSKKYPGQDFNDGSIR